MIRTIPFSRENNGRFLKIAEINLTRFGDVTKYFGPQCILRIGLPKAGYFSTRTYLCNFQYISQDLQYDFLLVENNDPNGLIRLHATNKNDMVYLYLEIPPYSYNEGYTIEPIFENRKNFIDFGVFTDFSESMEGAELTLTDGVSESSYVSVEVEATERSTISKYICERYKGYISIYIDLTIRENSGDIINLNTQLYRITEYVQVYNVTKKQTVILAAYANTKFLTLTSLGGSVEVGDRIIVNAHLKTV